MIANLSTIEKFLLGIAIAGATLLVLLMLAAAVSERKLTTPQQHERKANGHSLFR
jgi:hypothetical protein